MIINGVEYTPGLNRTPGAEHRYKSHLYKGPFGDLGYPMCRLGWNRFNGAEYSIWRNQTGLGICLVCLRRAEQGKDPVPPRQGFDVTDPDLDAPDGATVDGLERHGMRWEPAKE